MVIGTGERNGDIDRPIPRLLVAQGQFVAGELGAAPRAVREDPMAAGEEIPVVEPAQGRARLYRCR